MKTYKVKIQTTATKVTELFFRANDRNDAYAKAGNLGIVMALDPEPEPDEDWDTVKASIVVMSHLSDMEVMAQYPEREDRAEISNRAEFCKYIILKTKGDLTKQINPDRMYSDYLASRMK